MDLVDREKARVLSAGGAIFPTRTTLRGWVRCRSIEPVPPCSGFVTFSANDWSSENGKNFQGQVLRRSGIHPGGEEIIPKGGWSQY